MKKSRESRRGSGRGGGDHRKGKSWKGNSFENAKRDQFLKRVEQIYGVSPGEAEELVSLEHTSCLRINRLSDKSPEQILEEIRAAGIEIEPIPWCGDAYYLRSAKRDVSESALFQEGHVYLQNASSLIPPLALDPHPGDAILDVCAAPGGKAAHIASLTGNQGTLWVNDAIKPRAEKMRGILDTFHVKVDHLTGYPGQYLTKFIDRQFDRILLDAQCSGEGMLNLEHPRALRFWSPQRITKFSHLQKKMLVAAFKLLKPGGELVYSTCTFAPEENEETVNHLLKHYPDATVEPIPLDIPNAVPGLTSWDQKSYDPRLKQALRVVPTEAMEAFFVCRIGKAGNAS
jgi:NOL1/NOP2/sun family putative RNA methylase